MPSNSIEAVASKLHARAIKELKIPEDSKASNDLYDLILDSLHEADENKSEDIDNAQEVENYNYIERINAQDDGRKPVYLRPSDLAHVNGTIITKA